VLKIIVRFRSIILRTTGRLGWLPPTLARLCLGLVFFNSGWGKLHGLSEVIEYFRSLGIPAPEIQAPLAAGTSSSAASCCSWVCSHASRRCRSWSP